MVDIFRRKKKLPQFGKPVFTPREAEKLTPKERKRVVVITPEQVRKGVDIIPTVRGGALRGGRSGRDIINRTIQAEQKRQAEAKRLAEEKARKQAETNKRLAEEKARKQAEAKRLAEEKAKLIREKALREAKLIAENIKKIILRKKTETEGQKRRKEIFEEQKRKREELLTKIEQTKVSKVGRAFVEGGTESIVGSIVGLIALIKDPRKVVDIPEGIKQRVIELKDLAKTDKAKFLGALAGEVLLFKGIKTGKPTIKGLQESKINFIVEKPGKIKKTPLSKTFPEEFKFKINDKKVENFVRIETKKRGFDFNKLTKIEQNFLTGQVKAKIRTQPELFIPKTRQLALKIAKEKNLRKVVLERLEGKLDKSTVFKKTGKKIFGELTTSQKLALKRFSEVKKREVKPPTRKQTLIQIQKPITKQEVPLIKIVTGELTSTQKLALKRFNKSSKKQ